MSRETVEYVVEKSRELMAAPSCSKEAKEAAQAWLDAVGTEREAEETKKYIAGGGHCNSRGPDRICGIRSRSGGVRRCGSGKESGGAWTGAYGCRKAVL